MQFAPIILFVYNRPEHTRLTIEALQKNKLASESILYIFCDGLKTKDNKSEALHNDVKRIINSIKGFKDLIIKERNANYGLAKSIVDGVSYVLNIHGKAIVLEDDLITSEYFLQFMNDSLNVYDGCDNIYSVQGYMFPIETNRKNELLLPFTSTWGWGTWKSKWEYLELDLAEKEVIRNSKYLKERFNLGDYSYSDMLTFENNSWGIKWYYSVFRRNGLCVFPPRTLIKNVGFDNSGTNCNEDTSFNLQKLFNYKTDVIKQEFLDIEVLDKIENYFTMKKKSILKRILEKIFK
ncbi:MAG: hypothetical protein A2X12_03890 [Bacteroidetes bacterium GWE2_29_8]|nr:MAG: hypothetical protein A2X12_03890 [Bacteroidetes bacterium GWE2_29_8]OFY21882.1 MAG: hypothetical protein A2X02_05115 [Bacteroidetes bacterium GWF2_29_10]